MVELLSLVPVTNIDEISKVVPPPASGLPINSLPGWDRIPLCNKLPMLDTPTNEIIFSREKMGNRLWKPSEFILYDPNGYMIRLKYDPLHDPHLKNFYNQPANFRRIKEIGRVTDSMDVICTLKEFNDYRQYIRRLHIDLINTEVKRLQMNHRDMFLLRVAEGVAHKQAEKAKNCIIRSHSEIIHVRNFLDQQKLDKARDANERTKQIVAKINMLNEWRKEHLQELSQQRDEIRQRRIQRAKDDEECRVLGFRMKFEQQDINVKNFLETHHEELKTLKLLKAQADWQKRVEFRAWKDDYIQKLRADASLLKKKNVDRHKLLTQIKWHRIQMRIVQKSMINRQRDALKELTMMLRRNLEKKKPKKLKKRRKRSLSPCDKLLESTPRKLRRTKPKRDKSKPEREGPKLDGEAPKPDRDVRHSRENIEDAVSTAMSLHNTSSSGKMSTERILSSAKYIMERVVNSVERNLGEDLKARQYMYRRIDELFTRVKKHVLLKIEHVLRASDETASQKSSELDVRKSYPLSSSFILPLWTKSLQQTVSKTVSFGQIETIGQTAQEIDADVELRDVKSRTPTPASSLTSMNAMVKEICSEDDVQIPVKSHENEGGSYNIPNWTSQERIFVEHFYIKFKKSLLVGVERAVYDAIDVKKRETRCAPRRQILELDRRYLTKIMAESILTYNLNQYNYLGNTRLCVSALAAECLFDLENNGMLAPKYDSPYRIAPKCRCNIGIADKSSKNSARSD